MYIFMKHISHFLSKAEYKITEIQEISNLTSLIYVIGGIMIQNNICMIIFSSRNYFYENEKKIQLYLIRV